MCYLLKLVAQFVSFIFKNVDLNFFFIGVELSILDSKRVHHNLINNL